MIDLTLKSIAELAQDEFGENAGIVVSANDVLLLIDQLEAAKKQAESNRVDAECFRWWVHEAAANPVLVAKAIAHCITEDEYREVICGAMRKRDDAIKAAMQSTN